MELPPEKGDEGYPLQEARAGLGVGLHRRDVAVVHVEIKALDPKARQDVLHGPKENRVKPLSAETGMDVGVKEVGPARSHPHAVPVAVLKNACALLRPDITRGAAFSDETDDEAPFVEAPRHLPHSGGGISHFPADSKISEAVRLDRHDGEPPITGSRRFDPGKFKDEKTLELRQQGPQDRKASKTLPEGGDETGPRLLHFFPIIALSLALTVPPGMRRW